MKISMGANEIQNFVIRVVKMICQNCSYCVRKYPYHLCIMIILCVLYLFSPLVFTLLAYCLPVIGLAFLVCRIGVGIGHRTVKNVGSRSRRSCRSVYRIHCPKQHNESSFVQDPPGVLQNARETSDKSFNDMNAAEDKDNVVDKKALIEERPKEIREVRPVDHCRLDEKYRKCSLDDCKVKLQESLDDHHDVVDKEKNGRGNKTVGWIDDDEKSLMDLGISEVERSKRLEGLMERRRSRTLSKFQMIRNAMGVSSLHIPKKNPFLLKDSGDLHSPLPASAPAYMIKNNPFDLPYDPHEEKPILTGDSFEDEFMTAHQKEPVFCRRESSSVGNSAPSESTGDKHETYFDTDFAIKQLRRLGTSRLANKEGDNKQPLEKRLMHTVVADDNHAIEEGESSEKAINVVDQTKEHEVDHDVVSSDQSTSSSSSSEDEPPILRPNKEAILHCLSMSRMRVISQGKSLLRNAESFDCGPSALFEKSKTDCFFFGSNKRIHYGSTNSFASDMQVEVSELSSPRSTNISSMDDEGKRSLVNSTNPSEMDLNEVRLRDIDEMSEQGTTEPTVSKRDPDSDQFESTMKPEKINEDR